MQTEENFVPSNDISTDVTADVGAAVEGDTGAGDWKRAHAELVRLAALRAALDWDEGRSLVRRLASEPI